MTRSPLSGAPSTKCSRSASCARPRPSFWLWWRIVRLRDFFEVDAKNIAYGALCGLSREGKFDSKKLAEAQKTLGIDGSRANPATR